MPKQCVYCDQTQNLNTSFTITLNDGTKVTVDICDTHAEDATIKSARDAYELKQSKIKEVLDMAAKLGLNISESGGGIAIAQQQAKPAKQAPQRQMQQIEQLDPNDPDVISSDRVDQARGVVSVGGSTELGAVESHSSISTSSLHDKLPDDVRKGMVKMALVEGREGQPLAIPKKRVDGTGTTVYNVVKKENDQTLQSRFKKMAQASISDRPPDFKSGYSDTTVTCTMCYGECKVKTGKGTVLCPKCNGIGILSIY